LAGSDEHDPLPGNTLGDKVMDHGHYVLLFPASQSGGGVWLKVPVAEGEDHGILPRKVPEAGSPAPGIIAEAMEDDDNSTGAGTIQVPDP
jgi:hypothetical protein